MKHFVLIISILFSFSYCSCKKTDTSANEWQKQADRAKSTLDSLYKYYSIPESELLRETYPYDENLNITYLASGNNEKQNNHAYLWPFSGTFSAVNSLFKATKNNYYKEILNNKVFVGLEEYFDQQRTPFAYASYTSKSDPLPDRFYDDNIWIGLDFTDLYMMTNEDKYLEKAKLVWEFIKSGTDNKLGGGIYWCEQKKEAKHSCSNAPGSVYALKLFIATKDSTYFEQGEFLYEWAHKHLRDSTDNLYYDNINLEGKADPAKYSYNSGQMIQAAALLYKLTNKQEYLADAEKTAVSCYNLYFSDFETINGDKYHLLKKGDIWFTAIMFRGFIELYKVNRDNTYVETYRKNLDYAWEHMRADNGLFNTDWSGKTQDESKWLLTQAAMVEMYAQLAILEKEEN